MFFKGAKVVMSLILSIVSVIAVLILMPSVDWEVPVLQVESAQLTSKKAQFQVAEQILDKSAGDDLLLPDSITPDIDTSLYTAEQVEWNMEIYKEVAKYYVVNINNQRMSALLPISLSVTETGGGSLPAFSSLIPSSVYEAGYSVDVPDIKFYFENPDLMPSNFISTPSTVGPLQMSVGYGAPNPYGLDSETDMVAGLSNPFGFSLSSYEGGDRFSVRGVSSRQAYQVNSYLTVLDNYGVTITNEYSIVALLAYAHNIPAVIMSSPAYDLPQLGSYIPFSTPADCQRLCNTMGSSDFISLCLDYLVPKLKEDPYYKFGSSWREGNSLLNSFLQEATGETIYDYCRTDYYTYYSVNGVYVDDVMDVNYTSYGFMSLMNYICTAYKYGILKV